MLGKIIMELPFNSISIIITKENTVNDQMWNLMFVTEKTKQKPEHAELPAHWGHLVDRCSNDTSANWNQRKKNKNKQQYIPWLTGSWSLVY